MKAWIVFVVGVFVGCQATQPHEARRNYANGYQAERAGDWKSAKQNYQKATELDPSYGEAYYALALSQLHTDAEHGIPLIIESLKKAERTGYRFDPERLSRDFAPISSKEPFLEWVRHVEKEPTLPAALQDWLSVAKRIDHAMGMIAAVGSIAGLDLMLFVGVVLVVMAILVNSGLLSRRSAFIIALLATSFGLLALIWIVSGDLTSAWGTLLKAILSAIGFVTLVTVSRLFAQAIWYRLGRWWVLRRNGRLPKTKRWISERYEISREVYDIETAFEDFRSLAHRYLAEPKPDLLVTLDARRQGLIQRLGRFCFLNPQGGQTWGSSTPGF